MTDEPDRAGFSLSRWSRRKLEAGAEARPVPAAPTAAALPSLDSLGFDSDFTAFLRPEVDETLRRAALKRLFRDPRFNVMDGLDTYIGDYTGSDPIEPGVLADLIERGFGTASAAPPAVEPAPPVAGAAAPAAAEGEVPPCAAPSPQGGADAKDGSAPGDDAATGEDRPNERR